MGLFTNLQGYGATIGCFLDDCMSSDKFVASEIESCTKVCLSLPECEWWVWGSEEGEQKCWFLRRQRPRGRRGLGIRAQVVPPPGHAGHAAGQRRVLGRRLRLRELLRCEVRAQRQ